MTQMQKILQMRSFLQKKQKQKQNANTYVLCHNF